MSTLITVFTAVFIAELGDKTQLATLLFAGKGGASPWLVFFAAALALVTSTALAVLLGSFGAKYLEAVPLKLVAGVGFIAIGVWTLVDHFRVAA